MYGTKFSLCGGEIKTCIDLLSNYFEVFSKNLHLIEQLLEYNKNMKA